MPRNASLRLFSSCAGDSQTHLWKGVKEPSIHAASKAVYECSDQEKLKQCFSFRWSSCCPVSRMEIISHKKMSSSSELLPWVVNLHLLCISWAELSWAELSLLASQSWISVSIKDVSPVSTCPTWFPMTNTTAVPPGYTAVNSTVCVCPCSWPHICVFIHVCQCETVCVCVSVTEMNRGRGVRACVFSLRQGKQGMVAVRQLRCNTLLMWQTQ